jgi:hypothetical protein
MTDNNPVRLSLWEEVKRRTCWSILVAGEGFEPSTSGL